MSTVFANSPRDKSGYEKHVQNGLGNQAAASAGAASPVKRSFLGRMVEVIFPEKRRVREAAEELRHASEAVDVALHTWVNAQKGANEEAEATIRLHVALSQLQTASGRDFVQMRGDCLLRLVGSKNETELQALSEICSRIPLHSCFPTITGFLEHLHFALEAASLHRKLQVLAEQNVFVGERGEPDVAGLTPKQKRELPQWGSFASRLCAMAGKYMDPTGTMISGSRFRADELSVIADQLSSGAVKSGNSAKGLDATIDHPPSGDTGIPGSAPLDEKTRKTKRSFLSRLVATKVSDHRRAERSARKALAKLELEARQLLLDAAGNRKANAALQVCVMIDAASVTLGKLGEAAAPAAVRLRGELFSRWTGAMSLQDLDSLNATLDGIPREQLSPTVCAVFEQLAFSVKAGILRHWATDLATSGVALADEGAPPRLDGLSSAQWQKLPELQRLASILYGTAKAYAASPTEPVAGSLYSLKEFERIARRLANHKDNAPKPFQPGPVAHAAPGAQAMANAVPNAPAVFDAEQQVRHLLQAIKGDDEAAAHRASIALDLALAASQAVGGTTASRQACLTPVVGSLDMTELSVLSERLSRTVQKPLPSSLKVVVEQLDAVVKVELFYRKLIELDDAGLQFGGHGQPDLNGATQEQLRDVSLVVNLCTRLLQIGTVHLFANDLKQLQDVHTSAVAALTSHSAAAAAIANQEPLLAARSTQELIQALTQGDLNAADQARIYLDLVLAPGANPGAAGEVPSIS